MTASPATTRRPPPTQHRRQHDAVRPEPSPSSTQSGLRGHTTARPTRHDADDTANAAEMCMLRRCEKRHRCSGNSGNAPCFFSERSPGCPSATAHTQPRQRRQCHGSSDEGARTLRTARRRIAMTTRSTHAHTVAATMQHQAAPRRMTRGRVRGGRTRHLTTVTQPRRITPRRHT
jgi:hypothetical protein